MSEVHISLPVRNDSIGELKLCLEPYCEYFDIPPGHKVEVHAICEADQASPPIFVVGYADASITVYAPGAPTSLIDAYVTTGGNRMLPNG